ncbi:hypothetical protein F4810DRAFT_695048 [Camillea tinctor]|nr:hypothetical protein F4810DRAFT_695048 [Camillea tinctor]
MVMLDRVKSNKADHPIQNLIDFWNRKTYAQNYWDPRRKSFPKRQLLSSSSGSGDSHDNSSMTGLRTLSPKKRQKSNILDLAKYVMDMPLSEIFDVAYTSLDKVVGNDS